MSALGRGWWALLGRTALLLVAANLVCALYLGIAAPAPVTPEALARADGDAALARYGIEFFRRLYPGKSDAAIIALLEGQAILETTYEPFAELRNSASARGGATIHEAGFRVVGREQGPWPLSPDALNVFVFGDSTALGHGLEDDETIPAQLQALLRNGGGPRPVNVYNFGVGGSFSSQEVTYLQNQLRYGSVPDVVVFLDGLGDFSRWEGLTPVSAYYRDAIMTIRSLNAQLGRERGFLWHLGELARSLPMVRLAQRLAREPAAEPPAQPASADPLLAEPERLADVIDRWLVNRDIARGVAARFGFEALFVWQPVPLYKYDPALHAFDVSERARITKYGYPLMARLASERPLGPDFVWCADLQAALHESVYIDSVHYTAAMSRRVAECIAQGLRGSGALERASARVLAGRPLRALAHALIALRRERAVAQLFGPAAQAPSLEVDGSLDGLAGSRLVDASPHYGSLYEDIALAPGERAATYRASLRLRAGSSPYAQLVMQFMGEHSETYDVYFNPRTMQTAEGRGYATLEPDADGWFRLSLTAPAPGAERVRIQLIPRHGEAEDTGDLGFGGGQLWVDETPADVAAPGGS